MVRICPIRNSLGVSVWLGSWHAVLQSEGEDSFTTDVPVLYRNAERVIIPPTSKPAPPPSLSPAAVGFLFFRLRERGVSFYPPLRSRTFPNDCLPVSGLRLLHTAFQPPPPTSTPPFVFSFGTFSLLPPVWGYSLSSHSPFGFLVFVEGFLRLYSCCVKCPPLPFPCKGFIVTSTSNLCRGSIPLNNFLARSAVNTPLARARKYVSFFFSYFPFCPWGLNSPICNHSSTRTEETLLSIPPRRSSAFSLPKSCPHAPLSC